MKQRIMEALLDSNHNLSREEIMWAASHLPTTSEKGTNTDDEYVFDHNQDNLFNAVGCSKDDALKCADILTEITKKCVFEDEYRLSHAVEEVIVASKNHKALMPVIISKMFAETIEHIKRKSSEPDDDALKALLKMLRKKSDD